MKNFLTLIVIFASLNLIAQNKKTYLVNNRHDLNSDKFDFPQRDFKIIGFGAYHGSAKTENAEIKLLSSLTNKGTIKYYLPETDFSIAHYFNKYLLTGDTVLLKDLVTQYGFRVPQERTIEVYKKWKKLKELNDRLLEADKLKVVGIDLQVNYKYVSRHILELINDPENKLSAVRGIKNMVNVDTTSYAMNELSYASKTLKQFVAEYENNKSLYKNYILNEFDFNHIVSNLKITFKEKAEREKTIFENYLALDSVCDFKHNRQFLRMGFSHIKKAREGKEGYPYFFTRLIENGIYKQDKVLSIIGYLTNSKVVWDEIYDDNGNYKSYTIEAGFGIGDYEKEYFRGIQNLKDSKLSALTLFRLNQVNSPYENNEPDLIEVIMKEEKSNGEQVKGMATLSFLDYAILISDSKASIPIFEMK